MCRPSRIESNRSCNHRLGAACIAALCKEVEHVKKGFMSSASTRQKTVSIQFRFMRTRDDAVLLFGLYV